MPFDQTRRHLLASSAAATVPARAGDDRIGVWRICAGLALIAGMLRFGMVQSEPPRPEDARVDTFAAPSAIRLPLPARNRHGRKP